MPDLFNYGAHAVRSEAAHKLFFALRPPPEVAERAHGLGLWLRRRHRLCGQATPPERLHVSLNGLGRCASIPRRLVESVSDVMTGFEWPSFVVALDRCGSWGRGDGLRPLVMWAEDGVIGVRYLHEAIHARLAAARIVSPRLRAFEPHLTLLRDRLAVRPAPIEPLSWQVSEIALLDSLQGEGRHEVLGRWPLGDFSGSAGVIEMCAGDAKFDGGMAG